MSEISVPITTILASGLAFWLLVLSWTVINVRGKTGVALGEGDSAFLQRKTRAQANLTEYAPLFLILVGLAELQGGNSIAIWVLAGMFFVGRLAHGYALAFTKGNPAGRVGGIGLTLVSIAIVALYNLTLVVS